MKATEKTNEQINSEISKLKFDSQTLETKKLIQTLQQQLDDSNS